MKELIEMFGRAIVSLVTMWILFKEHSNTIAMIGALIVVTLWILLPEYELHNSTKSQKRGTKQ